MIVECDLDRSTSCAPIGRFCATGESTPTATSRSGMWIEGGIAGPTDF